MEDSMHQFSRISRAAPSVRSFDTTNTRGSVEPDDPPPGQQGEEDEEDMCRALCLFDFESDDPDWISFNKGEMLIMLNKHSAGWRGARRPGSDLFGWVPADYVALLSDHLADHLETIRIELRVFEYEAETRYTNAPVKNLADPCRRDSLISETTHYSASSRHTHSNSVSTDNTDLASLPPYDGPQVSPQSAFDVKRVDGPLRGSSDGYSPDSADESDSEVSPVVDLSSLKPVTPTPGPNIVISRDNTTPRALLFNKPTPPTPIITDLDHMNGFRPTANSTTMGSQNAVASTSRLPPRQAAAQFTRRIPNVVPEVYDDDDTLFVTSRRRPSKRGLSKVGEILGEGEAQDYYNAKVAHTALPWYLQPTHSGEEIRVEGDDSVKAGTIDALIERLTIRPIGSPQGKKYLTAFLTTFKSFTSSDKLFETLWAQYYTEPPPGLTSRERHTWAEKKNEPSRQRILQVLSEWLQQFRMMEDDPHLLPKLRQFLSYISDESNNRLAIRNLSQILDGTAHNTSPVTVSPQTSHRSSRWKSNIKDITQADPTDIAQHLTMYEARFYLKIRPQECMAWHKVKKGEAVRNLYDFIANNDKIASWVKTSILMRDGLARRAETVDKWIRVAEKCKHVNNISSTCAIVAALSSTVIERLHLTWAHAKCKGRLVPLHRLVLPHNNFGELRELLRSAENSCIPFIGMNLNDLSHIHDDYPDHFSIDPSSDYPQGLTLINFAKCQRYVEVIDSILKHQVMPHRFVEKPYVMRFIEQQLQSSTKEDAWFWQRSNELQQAEVTHGDIKRSLEEAGF